MRFNKTKLLDLDHSNLHYQYKLEYERIKHSPAKKNWGEWWMACWTWANNVPSPSNMWHAQKVLMYHKLHKKKGGQQVKETDPDTPLLRCWWDCTLSTASRDGVLNTGKTWTRWRASRKGSKKWSKEWNTFGKRTANRDVVIQPGEEKAPGWPYSSLSVSGERGGNGRTTQTIRKKDTDSLSRSAVTEQREMVSN